jgi:hypothetical protein
MACESAAVLIRKCNRGAPAQFGPRLLVKAGGEFGHSLIIEGHERAVECGVPQRRKKEAVMHVEPFGITLTLAPGDDVGSA